jgi:transposase InsO family protein
LPATKTFDKHLEDIDTILSLVAKSGVTLSPKKCHIGYQTLQALGHSISNLGIGTADGTIQAVKEFPRPNNVKELQRFLGLCVYYRKFVQGFSVIAGPLYNLLKNDVKYKWDESCQAAFDSLKEKLTTAPVLAHPNYEKPFLLYTDASIEGLGCVLAQQDEEGKEHPIIYLSRSLSPAEKNYAITELECLAIVWSIKKLHPYIDGIKFTLITDHSALQWLFDFKGPNRRLVRWSLELQPFRDYMTIKYREGKKHANVDPLSRAPVAACNFITHGAATETPQVPVGNPPPVPQLRHINSLPFNFDDEFMKELKIAYSKDPDFQVTYATLQTTPGESLGRYHLSHDGWMYYRARDADNVQFVIPAGTQPINFRARFIRDHHDCSGHLGMEKTLSQVSRHCFWFGMAKDVKEWVRSCHKCQVNKSANKSYALHQALPVPTHRWHTVTMDFAGPFPPSGEGHWDMVTVVIDKLTKRAHFIPCKSSDNAATTAVRFWDAVVRLHGCPEVIVSDRDAKFTSLFWTTLTNRFGIKLAMSSAYHPQTDGQSERMVRTLKDMLRSAVSHKQTDWTKQLAPLEFAYNNSVHPSSKMTPFELDLGYHPRTPYSILRQDAPDVASVNDFIEHLDTLRNLAITSLEKARDVQTRNVNAIRPRPTTFEVGENVLLSTKYIQPAFMRQPGNKKLKAKFIGPFEIVRKIGQTTYELDLPASMKVRPVINVEYLRKYNASPERLGQRENVTTLNTDALIGSPVIDFIRGHRLVKGQLQFLVHYRDTSDLDDVWQKRSAISQKGEVDAYMRRVSEEELPRNPVTTRDLLNQRAAERIRDLRAKDAAEAEARERIIAALEGQISAAGYRAAPVRPSAF